jgi:hypothetical protein
VIGVWTVTKTGSAGAIKLRGQIRYERMPGGDRAQLSAGKSAQDLAGLACARACLFCGVPVFRTALRVTGGQVLMEAGDLVLGGRDVLDHRAGLLVQRHAALDELGRVRQPGRQAPFAFRRRPAGLCLMPPAACLPPLHRRLLAVETLPAQRQQGTRPRDGLQRALLQGLDGSASSSCALIQFPLALIDLPLALDSRGLPLVSLALALISPALPLVGQRFTLISRAIALFGRTLALFGQALALIGRAIALFGRTLVRSLGLTPSRRAIPRVAVTGPSRPPAPQINWG